MKYKFAIWHKDSYIILVMRLDLQTRKRKSD